MLKKTFAASLVLAAVTLGTHTPSFAIEAEQDFKLLTYSAGMDRSHDGVVSAKELPDPASQVHDDSRTTATGADRAGFTQARTRDVLRSLYIGG